MAITAPSTQPLGSINEQAAAHLASHGWVQTQMEDEHGRTCLTGALRACSHRPGDWTVAAAVYRSLGRGEEWNDAPARSADDVTDLLRQHPITDTDLRSVLGPQWRQTLSFVRRCANLTGREQHALIGDATRQSREDRVGVLSARRNAVLALARAALPDLYTAGNAANEAAPLPETMGRRAAQTAALHRTALAVTARDMFGHEWLSGHDYDVLTAPWRRTVGRLHPDDGHVPGAAR